MRGEGLVRLGRYWAREIRECFRDLLAAEQFRCPFCWSLFPDQPQVEPSLPREGFWFPQAGCPGCLALLPFVTPPFCDRCGRPLRQTASRLCTDCRRYYRFFVVARAVGVYDGALRHWIQLLKYGDRVEIAAGLGELMAELAGRDPALAGVQAVVPVPVSPQRQRERGYNQAELLARPVALRLGLPVITDAVLRVHGGTPQSLLSGVARRRNAFGLYEIGRPAGIAGRSVLLVDDILTTGATINEVARLLLKAGAAEVRALVAAVGVQRADWQEKDDRQGYLEGIQGMKRNCR